MKNLGVVSDPKDIATKEYVDSQIKIELIFGYYYSDKFYTELEHANEIAGATSNIYVDKSENTLYRYDGSAFVGIGGSNEEFEAYTDAEVEALWNIIFAEVGE